tara:strand:+ start:9796 stop:10020 length:225 start_codon:yes stop_codon:yes gene_type:complete
MNIQYPNNRVKSCQLVRANDMDDEFFYKDSDLKVEGGDPVGVDLEVGDKVHLILFDEIYWGVGDEETEEDGKTV